MSQPDFERVLAILTKNEVEFVLIGGLAAIANGSPFPTEDVDVTPKRSQANLDNLSRALDELNAKIFSRSEPLGVPFGHDGASLGRSDVWNLATDYGRLDVSFTPSGTTGFADLSRDAFDLDLDGARIRVASLADIIRSKQTANRDKDRRVLPTLREILASKNPRNGER